MKKSILNLKGAQELSKNEQKAVNGGKRRIVQICYCPFEGGYDYTAENCYTDYVNQVCGDDKLDTPIPTGL